MTSDYITADQRVHLIKTWKSPACELSDKRLAYLGLAIMGLLLALTYFQ